MYTYRYVQLWCRRTANTSSATSREKSHYPYLCVCVCVYIYYMLVLRFDHIVMECVCDVLDIIIVITVLISSYIIFGLRRKTYKFQTTATATERLPGNSHRISRWTDRNIRTVNHHLPVLNVCLMVRY